MNEKVITGTTEDENGKAVHTYSTKRAQLQKEITEAFIKEYASVFIHEKSSPDYSGEMRGPEYLGKKKPPNVKVEVKNGSLQWEIQRNVKELVEHGKERFRL